MQLLVTLRLTLFTIIQDWCNLCNLNPNSLVDFIHVCKLCHTTFQYGHVDWWRTYRFLYFTELLVSSTYHRGNINCLVFITFTYSVVLYKLITYCPAHLRRVCWKAVVHGYKIQVGMFQLYTVYVTHIIHTYTHSTRFRIKNPVAVLRIMRSEILEV